MRPILRDGILMHKNRLDACQPQEYVIAFLSESDLPSIMSLQKMIRCHLHRNEILEPFSLDFMKQHLSDRGFILGALTKDKLVAFRNVYFPGKRDKTWNLGMDIGLCGEELEKVANLQMVCVHPDYRGNGLAMQMNRLSLELLKNQGTYEHVCATVSPYNFWNLRILLNSGFHINNLKRKYGGKMRYIVHQQIDNPVKFDPAATTQISLINFMAQMKLFGAGYCGLAIRPRNNSGQNCDPMDANQWEIVFKRPEQTQEVARCA